MQKLKIIFTVFLLLVFHVLSSQAQILSAKVGINGLTCSQCSKSVYMSFKKLDFVKKIDMDLEETVAQLDFYTDKPIQLEAIKKAIDNAGFSLRNIALTIQYQDTSVQTMSAPIICINDYCFYLDKKCEKEGLLTFELIGEEWNANKKLNAKHNDWATYIPKTSQKMILGLCK